ncbi:peptidoglycan editing factor PgeF [Patescibacteria group bacterium]|nr:peptidoglycan editing factor PgeF [Patescibacteria group bacterium]
MMLRKTNKGFYTLTNISNFKNVVHGFSTTEFGDLKTPSENQPRFFDALGLKKPKVIRPEQIHKGKVSFVGNKSNNPVIAGSDGIVTYEKNLFLVVLVADCLPILAFDPKREIIGIAHVGWRGTIKNIAVNLIKTFTDQGSKPKDILIGLGPTIEFCHYEVKKNVGDKFERSGLKKAVLKSLSGKICLDLKLANLDQIKKAGIPIENVDVSLKECTYENTDFYSFRRDKTEKRTAALIGLKSNEG